MKIIRIVQTQNIVSIPSIVVTPLTVVIRSSYINDVIKAVLNFFFFLQKDFARTKSTKNTKSTKALKRTKKLRQKHKNSNERISDYFPLRIFLGTFFIFVRL